MTEWRFVPERLQRAHALLERGVADGAYAGAVALIAMRRFHNMVASALRA